MKADWAETGERFRLAVAEAMLPVGRLGGVADGDQVDHRGREIEQRIDQRRQQADRTGRDIGDGLGADQNRRDRDRGDGGQLLQAVRAVAADRRVGPLPTGVPASFTDRAPRCSSRPGAPEEKPHMQPEGPVLPELDALRNDPVARPVRRPRDRAQVELRRILGDARLEFETADQRLRLLRGPGADLADPRARSEVCIRLLVVDPLDPSFHAHLPAQRLPVEAERGAGVGGELMSLAAAQVGVEGEATAHRHPSAACIRAEGMPSGVAVASVMAFGSLGSLRSASASHALNWSIGSRLRSMLMDVAVVKRSIEKASIGAPELSTSAHPVQSSTALANANRRKIPELARRAGRSELVAFVAVVRASPWCGMQYSGWPISSSLRRHVGRIRDADRVLELLRLGCNRRPGVVSMFVHNKRLMYTVRVSEPNPRLATLMLEQFGGPQGELRRQCVTSRRLYRKTMRSGRTCCSTSPPRSSVIWK